FDSSSDTSILLNLLSHSRFSVSTIQSSINNLFLKKSCLDIGEHYSTSCMMIFRIFQALSYHCCNLDSVSPFGQFLYPYPHAICSMNHKRMFLSDGWNGHP